MAQPQTKETITQKPEIKLVKSIYQKLAEIKKSVDYLQKTKPTSEAKYAYVSSGDVLIAIRKSMEEQGLLLIPTIKGHTYTEIVKKEGQSSTILTELDIEYTWVDIENPTNTLVINWYGQGVDISGEKGVGKALTYAEKYFFLKFFNIPTDKDDPDVIENRRNGKKETTERQETLTEEQIFAKIFELKTVKEVTEFTNKHVNNISDKGAFLKALKEQRIKVGA